MVFDVPKIDSILNNMNDNDYRFSNKCWKKWLNEFLNKDNQFNNLTNHLSILEYKQYLKTFKETDCSEKSFKKWIPKFKYDNYISPWDYNIKVVSENKIQKVAFELQEHIPLEYTQLCKLLKTIYWTTNTWDFNKISSLLDMYDQDLYLKSKIYLQLESQKSVS